MPCSVSRRWIEPARQASNRSVQPPMCSPPMKICGIVGEPVRLREHGADLVRRGRRPGTRRSRGRRCDRRCRAREQLAHATSRTRTTRARTARPARRATSVRRRSASAVGVERRRRGSARPPARGGAAGASKRQQRRRARDLELLGRHLLADALEQRRRQVALAGVGQHAEDVGARLARGAPPRAPPPASRRSRCRRRCLPAARARAPGATPRRRRPARSRRSSPAVDGVLGQPGDEVRAPSPASGAAGTAGGSARGSRRRRAAAGCRCASTGALSGSAATIRVAGLDCLQHARDALERAAGAEAR